MNEQQILARRRSAGFAAFFFSGVCAISLSSTGSRQHGIRVCVSQMNRPEQFELLDRRLEAFAEVLAILKKQVARK